ncbi:MAG: YitT family protein [Bacteroidales bacterium]|nr:YitT family protein [Bacteroidales bacterium]MBQ9710932.1 YitT family protein [Bacteroidales bacterium]
MKDKILEALRNLLTVKFWKDLVIMTLGMLVASAAVYYFMLPSNLVLGSITGLSIVLSNLFAMAGITIKVSVMVTVINAILLLMAWFLIGHEFGAKTVYTALILGPMLEFWEKVLPYEKLIEPGQTSVMGDLWFDLLCFVLVVSFSQTILFNINASTGGLDILAKIVNKYFHFDIGKSVTVAGAIICSTAFAVNPFRLVIVGLVGTFINGLAIDHFTSMFNRRKRVCIISKEYEKIRSYIINDLSRGCSLYGVTGGYSGQDYIEIQTLLTQDEFASLMAFMKDNDIHSFTTAGNVNEVYGLWNDKKGKKMKKQLDK